jgi:16S rRNA processing protein RimM
VGDRLVVGRIIRPHGIRGEVVVESASHDGAARYAVGSKLGVGDPDEDTRTYTVAGSRPHQGRLLVLFEEVADRTQAEALRGALISIPGADAQPLPEGQYYPHDLEGMTVVDEEGNELGVMSDVLENPANDLWVVRSRGKDVLVPAVKEIVIRVDVNERRIVLRPIPGLFD